MKQYELKTRQICLFCIAFLPITKFFVMPSLIASVAGEDMWISVLLSTAIGVLTLWLITVTCKRTNTDFCELLESCVGKVGSKIILCIYALTFLLKGVMPVIEQKDYVELTLFFTKPDTFYFIPFFFAAFYLATKRLRAIGRLSDIFWIITVVGYVLLFILSLPNLKFESLLPVFAHGALGIAKGSYISTAWFSDTLYFLFFIGQFKFEKHSTVKILISYAVFGLMVVFFAIVFFSTFTTIAFKQHFALTETSKYTTVINNTGRFDYLGIGLLLTSGIISMALPMFFATHVICRAFDIKKRWIVALLVTLFFVLPITVFSEYANSISSFITSYGNIIFILTSVIIPMLLPLLTIRRKNYEIAKG